MNLDQRLVERDAAVLVLAPHPDDESLAAGGLIQRALEQGARVGIVYLTDGDNNPWPQRVLEKRLRIGARQREAWGARRRGEAQDALRILDAEKVAVQRLGWADGDVTWRLLDETAALMVQMRAILERERPSLLVLPDLADRHPDHSALHVLMELVLNGMPAAARPDCLGYLLHGRERTSARPRIEFNLTPAEQQRKRQAILAHTSQIALSRGRLLRFAGDRECFTAGIGNHGLAGARLPWRPPRWLLPSMALIAVDAGGGQRLHLQPGPGGTTLTWRDGRAAAWAPRPLQAPYYVKLYSRLPSPWVFDGWGWLRFMS